jgi:hypothetical protein
LQAVTAGKAADRRRQWAAILDQMFSTAFGHTPGGSRRALGRLLKQAGGGLDGALAVAEAIRLAAERVDAGQGDSSPLDEVSRLVGQAGRQLGSSETAGQSDLLPNDGARDDRPPPNVGGHGRSGRQLGSSETAGQGDLLPNDGGRDDRPPPGVGRADETGRQLGSSETTGQSDLLPNDGPFPWPSILEWYGYLADKLPPELRELSPGQEAVLALHVAEIEAHRLRLPEGFPGADVGGDGWIVAALQEMVTCGAREFRAPLVYLRRIVERWKREGFKSDGKPFDQVCPERSRRDHGKQGGASSSGYGGHYADLVNCPNCTTLRYPDELCGDCGRCYHCCACEAYAGPGPDTDETGEGEPASPDPHTMSPDRVWQAALGELQLQMTRGTFNTWLRPTRVIGREGNVFTVGVENEYIRDWLSNRLIGTVQRTVASIVGEKVEVKFVVQPRKRRSPRSKEPPAVRR